MLKPKVFVTRAIPEVGLRLIQESCSIDVWPEETPPPIDILHEKVRGIDGLLCLLTENIDAELMDHAGKQLKVISSYAVGYDNIDIQAATERGILVTNTPGVLMETTADLAFSLLMSAARRIVEGVDYVKAGKWVTWGPKTLLGRDVHGATLGIIGLGEIGSAVAQRALGFDMDIIYYDHKSRPEITEKTGARMCESLDELLSSADFISLHVPLTSETRHLIDANAFKKMKETAILINTSRGQVVDSDALYDALKTRQIAYAALDVTDPEPLPVNHKLLTLENCIVIPHLGSASIATRNKMAVIAAENLIAALSGERPKHIVNPEAFRL
jgi:lactate dehydrogenase-like 2-hydroxyacid dehydrogenase